MDFTLLRTFSDTLEDEWNALLDQTASHVPFLRYEYLRAWWKTMGGGEWQKGDLMLITARQEGKLVGAAPLFFSRDKGVDALYLVGSIEVSDYLDLLAAPEDMAYFVS
jgi:CelD/BcsL family acetyltransferase involved in cellulose biosynthesis